jgi:hypothetical protein
LVEPDAPPYLHLRYPPRSLLADYVRAGTGVGISAGVLATNAPSWPILGVFGGVLVLFGGYGARTIHHTAMRLHVDADGIRSAGLWSRRIGWTELRALKLRYYGKRRGAQQTDALPTGFHQLTLRTDRGRMTLESNLESFAYVVWRAARAARAARLSIDPVTAENMLALAVDPDGESRPPEEVCDLAARIDGIQL